MTKKRLNSNFGFWIPIVFFLLIAFPSNAVQTESMESATLPADNVRDSDPESNRISEASTNLKEIASQLDGLRKTIDGKLTEIMDISSDIKTLSQNFVKLPEAIEQTSPGFFSSLLGWIFQLLAIAVGAGVALHVMNKQFEVSWNQHLVNQLRAQKISEENSQESWKQLFFSLGVKERLESERATRDNEAKLRENEKVQEALKIGLQIYVGALSDYAGLAAGKIGSISEKSEEAFASLSSIVLPSPPPGLWENLHSYTSVISDASSMAIAANHLYELGIHYSEFQKKVVINMFECAKNVEEEEKEKKSEAAITALREYKKSLVAYFNDIKEVCENVMSKNVDMGSNL